jgi:hypothetical protein
MSFQCHFLVDIRPACDRLSLGCHHLHSVFLLTVFPVLLASFVVFHFIYVFALFLFSLYVFFFFFSFLFFSFNKARSSLFDLPICILMLCGVFALSPDLWVVDVNDILAFRSRRISFVLRVFCSQGRVIIAAYALDYVCLVQI